MEIGRPGRLGSDEHRDLAERCSAFNLVFYTTSRGEDVTRAEIRALGRQLGLTVIDHNLCGDADGIAATRVVEPDGGRRHVAQDPVNPRAGQAEDATLPCRVGLPWGVGELH